MVSQSGAPADEGRAGSASPGLQSGQITDRPLVSVTLIFLNGEDFIAEAIESVLAQTFTKWELVLVDDGSSDRSTAIAKDYAVRFPDRIRYIDHQGHANLGMSTSRNAGVAASTGALLAFIDADDVWISRKLEMQVELLQSYPEAAVVFGSLLYWRSWDREDALPDQVVLTAGVADRFFRAPDALLLAYPLGYAPGAGVDLMVHRTIFETVGGFEAEFRGLYEDQAFILKVLLTYPAYISSIPWLKYRQHRKSNVYQSHEVGSYERDRERFLSWFERYIAGRAPDPKVVIALKAARQSGWKSKARKLRHRVHWKIKKLMAP